MLSLSPVKSSGQAHGYFGKDNYYTKDETIYRSGWFGRGAASLDLKGRVAPEDFLALLEGKVNGQQLGRIVKDEAGNDVIMHRPGLDLTFSAPKSVSIMAEVFGDERLRKAHESAVETALSFLESQYAVTRSMVRGQKVVEKTGNLVIARFMHNVSRELDPQTHTHCIVLNMTRREDGEWRSLSNEAFWNHQRLAGAIYTAALAKNVQELGFGIDRTDEKGNFEIRGVGKDVIEHFSKRSKQIDAAITAAGGDPSRASPRMRETATLDSRRPKQDVDHPSLVSDWNREAVELGLDRNAVQASADGVIDENLRKVIELDGRKALGFAVAHVTEREAVVQREELLRVAIEYGATRVDPVSILKAYEEAVRKEDLYEDAEGNVTTPKMRQSEQWLLSKVHEGKGSVGSILSVDGAQVAIEAYENAIQRNLTPGQRDSVMLALTTKDRVVAVQGFAGTGKTTMLDLVNREAESAGYTVRGMAVSGAAALELRKGAGIDSSTVKMFMIREAATQKALSAEAARLTVEAGEGAIPIEPKSLRGRELWIVDEGSFMGQREMARLTYYAENAGARILLVGDKKQLQSIEAGKPFEVMQETGIAVAQMTEIRRQQVETLQRPVEQIVAQRIERAWNMYDRAGLINTFEVPDKLIANIAARVANLTPEERRDTVVITPYNKDRREINSEVRVALQETGQLDRDENTAEILVGKGLTRAQIKSIEFYERGDRVLIGRDYRSIDLKKGEIGKVTEIDQRTRSITLTMDDGRVILWQPYRHSAVEVYEVEQRLIAAGDAIRITKGFETTPAGSRGNVLSIEGKVAMVEFANGNVVPMDLDKERHWDHAYAATVHSAQGRTASRTYFHIPLARGSEDATDDPDYELRQMGKIFGERSFYVGVTRATHELGIFTTDKGKALKAILNPQDKTSAWKTFGPLPEKQTSQAVDGTQKTDAEAKPKDRAHDDVHARRPMLDR